MAPCKFSKLDIWQISLRVTGSSHTAETEELETEDPSDVSVHLCTGRHAATTPGWQTSADEVWQPTVRGQEEALPGDENISSQCAVSERSTFWAQMADLYL